MKVSVSPFLLPEPNSVVHSGWSLYRNEGFEPLPEELDSWDYQTNLKLACSVEVDGQQILTQCSLGSQTRLRLVVKAKSDRTKAQFTVFSAVLPTAPDKVRTNVNFDLRGTELSGRLELTTYVVLDAGVPLELLAPHHRGSILWRDSTYLHLQGIGSQFPTDAEDFRITRPELPNALWQLDIDLTDPETSFAAAVRLVLNTNQPAVEDMLQRPNAAESKRLQHLMDIDVTRQLAVAAVNSDAVMEQEPDTTDISISAVLRCLLQQLWPNISDPRLLRTMWDLKPSQFEAHVQSVRGKI